MPYPSQNLKDIESSFSSAANAEEDILRLYRTEDFKFHRLRLNPKERNMSEETIISEAMCSNFQNLIKSDYKGDVVKGILKGRKEKRVKANYSCNISSCFFSETVFPFRNDTNLIRISEEKATLSSKFI